ncbi:MAG: response regulator, partial [Clostridia bacterium]|nr:response regulator [Clostridia bacterium]
MIRLLLVDDSPLFCAQFRGLARWEEQGIAIQDEARNGKMAIECIERNPPDIILTDISMPVMDGIGLIEYVRVRHPQIPVVALSAYDDFDYVRGSLRNGACDYILKHKLDVGQLTELIRGVVRKGSGNGGGGRTVTGAGSEAGDGEESGDRAGSGTETGIGAETRAVTGDSSESRRAFFALALSGWYTDPEEAALRMEKLRIAFPTDGCVPILMGIDPRKSGGEEFTEPMIQLLLECLNRRIWEYLPLKEDLMLLLIPGSR